MKRAVIACRGAVLLLTVLLTAIPRGSPLAASEPQDFAGIAARLEKILRDNIVRFWLPRSLDRQYGGYIINFGPRGERTEKDTKGLVTQARMVWFFARLARSGLGEPIYSRPQLLEAADHGYRFLREKLWDERCGGFYWEVDASGNTKLRSEKRLYGQGFALYALSEYYLASQKDDVLDLATQLFDVLEAKAHDWTFGGYPESLNADWTADPAPAPGMGDDPGAKRMNTHLHLLEAMTSFYEARRLPSARDRLVELIAIESSAVVRKGPTAVTDEYERDWTPRLGGGLDRVSYGHDLENVWLLIEANETAGFPNHPFLDLYRALFASSLTHGYDREKGGFYHSGPYGMPADRHEKIWWVQAEALVGALRLYELTRDPAYWEVFEKTLDFVENHQVDWDHGGWHRQIDTHGKASGDKADFWKAAYHNGRAMIECVEALRRLGS